MATIYQQLCPVLFGVGALEELGTKVKEMNGSKAFCICDQGVKMTGVIDRIEKILKNNGISMMIFDDVLPDAPNNIVDRAGETARNFGADVVIGVGGGSSLDTAKAVSVLVDNELPISQYYIRMNKSFRIVTPLILIPTAAGTGSEVTIMSVVHDEDSNAKEAVFRAANLAIVDPQLTVTAPPGVTAATALDAMAHAMEAYTSQLHNPKADTLALEAIRLIAENVEAACHDGNNIEARTNLSYASNIAGMAFNDASVHFGHAIAHELGIQFHMPHGVACALTLPALLYVADVMPERIRKIAAALGMSDIDSMSAQEATIYVLNKIKQLLVNVGIKSLSAQGISVEQAKSCAKGAVEKNGFIAASPKPMTVEIVEHIIEKMYYTYK